jgi:tartrate-resistant acid phosphatase type 5
MIFHLLLCLLFFQAPADGVKERLAAVQQKLKLTDPAAVAELIEQAGQDPEAAIRRAIIDRLGRTDRPEVRALLERHAASDPDAGVALLALERMRQQDARSAARIFERRLALAHSANDEKALAMLTAEHQHWVSTGRGATLPAFLEQPPPVFAATSKASVRVVGFGDFGEAGPAQQDVAKAVAGHHREKPFDLGVLFGDNIVPVGVSGPADVRWRKGWEEIYGPLGIPFYATTGNHDWGLADSPAAEILYSQRSPTWRMPALYYSFTAGPAQFFAVATNAMSETQVRWLERELARSTARWKIVYGHHPIYSHGEHGDTAELQRLLLPVLKNHAQVYIAGHEHLVQDLQSEGGVHFLVAPSAGQKNRPVKTGPKTLAADTFEGFTVFDIDEQHLKVSFVDCEGKVRYQADIP